MPPVLVTIRFDDQGNAMLVLEDVFGIAPERFECRIAIAVPSNSAYTDSLTGSFFQAASWGLSAFSKRIMASIMAS